jgi:hypothetical protein
MKAVDVDPLSIHSECESVLHCSLHRSKDFIYELMRGRF